MANRHFLISIHRTAFTPAAHALAG